MRKAELESELAAVKLAARQQYAELRQSMQATIDAQAKRIAELEGDYVGDLEGRVCEQSSALEDMRIYLERGAPRAALELPVTCAQRREYEGMLSTLDDALSRPQSATLSA